MEVYIEFDDLAAPAVFDLPSHVDQPIYHVFCINSKDLQSLALIYIPEAFLLSAGKFENCTKHARKSASKETTVEIKRMANKLK